MQTKNRFQWLTALLFPAILLYFEVLLRVTTGGQLLQLGTVFMIIFCIAYGAVGYLLSSICTNQKCNRVITVVLAALTAFPYLVEYFISRQFGIFYDLTTIFRGAADAVTGFTRELFALIFCWNGFLMITLFFLPAILLAIFGRRIPLTASTWRRRIAAVVAAVLLLFGARAGLLLSNPLNLLWTTQYNFQSSVNTFGLITGIGLDITNLFIEEDNDFEEVNFPVFTEAATEATESTEATVAPSQATESAAVEETAEQTEPTEVTEPPVVYVPQVMDLDLDDPDASKNIQKLNEYVAAQVPSMTNEYTGLFEGKNLIMITAEAFSAEVIDPSLTPTLYRMAHYGIQFTDFYQPSGAGTTGGEYQNIFGMLATDGGASFKKTRDNINYFTLGNQLDRLGYYGRAYHNNDYTFYDRHQTHNNLGYSDGFIGYGNGIEEYVIPTWPLSDLEMFQGSLSDYIDKQPFNLYYMTVSGHSNYYVNANDMSKRHWDRVSFRDESKQVRAYRACQLELEDSMAFLLKELKAAGVLENTVICIASDHFPYGLDQEALDELYGYKPKTNFEKDHSALIIWSPCLEKMDPIIVDSPAFTPDIVPTLSNLFGTEYDSRLLPGRDVLSDTEALVYNLAYDWKTDYGTYISGSGQFIPTDPDWVPPEDYITTVSAIVRNKVNYSSGVLEYDYFRYLFGEEE